MADGHHIGKCWKCCNSPTNGGIGMKLGWYDMSAMMRLPWQRPLPSNGALNIQQLLASHDQILKFLKFKMATVAMLENVENAITRLWMDWLGRNLFGRIQSCPRHVCRDAIVMVTAVAEQRLIEHSAVMGVWRPNARTNFDEIYYTTTNYDLNDGLLTKY